MKQIFPLLRYVNIYFLTNSTSIDFSKNIINNLDSGRTYEKNMHVTINYVRDSGNVILLLLLRRAAFKFGNSSISANAYKFKTTSSPTWRVVDSCFHFPIVTTQRLGVNERCYVVNNVVGRVLSDDDDLVSSEYGLSVFTIHTHVYISSSKNELAPKARPKGWLTDANLHKNYWQWYFCNFIRYLLL